MLWETQTLKDVFPFQMLWENVGRHINGVPTRATTTPSSSNPTATAACNNHQNIIIIIKSHRKQTNKRPERGVCNDVYVITREKSEKKIGCRALQHPSIHRVVHLLLKGEEEKRSGQMEQERKKKNWGEETAMTTRDALIYDATI